MTVAISLHVQVYLQSAIKFSSVSVLLGSNCLLDFVLNASPRALAAIAVFLDVALDARAAVSVMGSLGLGRTRRTVFLVASDYGFM